MKQFPPGSMILAICFLVANLPAQETVVLKSGQSQNGKVVSRTEDAITFEFIRGGRSASIELTWKQIDRIVFASPDQQTKALEDPDNTSTEVFESLWSKTRQWIDVPDSMTSKIGLAYAAKLVEAKDPGAMDHALELYRIIVAESWNRDDQTEAAGRRLNILLESGRERDAIREAEAFATETENPLLLLEAKRVLAINAYEKLKVIEDENPRWYLDDEVRPERNILYNNAIDHSLFAFLFYGSIEEPAARGLYDASRIYEFGKDFEKSRICAEDILRLYPGSRLVPNARDQVAKLSKLKSE